MKLCIFLLVSLSAGWAQQPQNAAPAAPAPAPAPALPNLPDDQVIAEFEDGGRFTFGDFKRVYAVMPPQNQQMALRDRQMFLQQWALMRKLALMAEKEKLAETTPTKEALEYYRMQIMMQAELNTRMNSITVDPGAIVKTYDQNKEKYKQVKVKAIYVAFSANPGAAAAGGKKALTEEQAKAKAVKLLADLRGGADFVKLVKENSDDETSRNKDGDFATLHPNDNVPDAVRAAVFALKPGEVSEPVRQPGGYYLLRAEEVTYRPLSQVRDEIFSQIKQEQYGKWLDDTNRGTKVLFLSPEFLGVQPLGTISGPGK
jgi:peptidyl-prolyl cis-trans isomerase C